MWRGTQPGSNTGQHLFMGQSKLNKQPGVPGFRPHCPLAVKPVLSCPNFHPLCVIGLQDCSKSRFLGFICTLRNRASAFCQRLCPIFCLFVPSVRGADAGNGIRVFIPDIGMFMVGLGIWLLCRSLVQKRPPEDMAQYNEDFQSEEQVGFIWAEMKSVCVDGLKSSFNFVVVLTPWILHTIKIFMVGGKTKYWSVSRSTRIKKEKGMESSLLNKY